MYTDKMIAIVYSLHEKWKFWVSGSDKVFVKEMCMQQKSISVWSPCMVTLHLITVQ